MQRLLDAVNTCGRQLIEKSSLLFEVGPAQLASKMQRN